MRQTIFLLTFLGILASCAKKEVPPEELALQTAVVYYEQLLSGDYDSFVDGMNYNDTVVPEYREQLVTNMKMYIGRQKKEHQGIKSVMPLQAQADTLTHTVNAFLLICYDDSAKEQVVVPMVEKNGVWLMK